MQKIETTELETELSEMAKQMTGAEMVVAGPAGPGRRDDLRLSRRRGAADLRRAVPPGQGQARARAPRAGRGPCGRRLCALHRQGRRAAGDLRPRRDQRHHRPHRRADGFHPARLHHRPGADAPDRLGRVPGMRHGRHHPPLHQAQLPRALDRGPAAHPARGVLCRAQRPSRARSSIDLPKDIQFASGAYARPEEHPAQDLSAARQGRHRQDPSRPSR